MKKFSLVLALLLLTMIPALKVLAAANSTFNQVITVGTLSTDILDASGTPVSTPSITMTSKTFSFTCRSFSTSDYSTGTLGTDSQRLYVINPGAADNGWTLDIAATSGPTALWHNNASTQTYDFNDPNSSGCTDGGGDTDTKGGQMTLAATGGTITTDCGGSCSTTGIAKGSAVAFEEGAQNSVNLLNASSGSDDSWRGYLTGVNVAQTIPAQQPVDTYIINMTLSVTAS